MNKWGCVIKVSDDFDTLSLTGNKASGLYAAMKILATVGCDEDDMEAQKEGKLPMPKSVLVYMKFAASEFQNSINDDIAKEKGSDQSRDEAIEKAIKEAIDKACDKD